MRALLIDCHKNTAVCLEEIMKEPIYNSIFSQSLLISRET